MKRAKRPEAPRLTRDDWLDAAYRAVVEGGFDNARVLTIADTLGVTRGSFYWHFADRADLIAALLARWRTREIESARRWESEATADARADLERLLAAALAHAGSGLEKLRFELALRGLGRRDPAVANMLVEADQLRMSMFQHKFERLTGDAATAAEYAALFYLAIVGSHQALSRPSSSTQVKEYLKRIISKYLIRWQAPVPRRRTSAR